jgi:hypothetical protein
MFPQYNNNKKKKKKKEEGCIMITLHMSVVRRWMAEPRVDSWMTGRWLLL